LPRQKIDETFAEKAQKVDETFAEKAIIVA
jgi:hypothetical protein